MDMRKDMSARNQTFDIARAICMLWIVGVWHMWSEYIGRPLTDGPLGDCITGGVLATFFFISGRLSGRGAVRGFQDALRYWKRRFAAFYPLFALSAATLYLLRYIASKRRLALSLLCLSSFFPPMPPTIWFAEIVQLFYLFTPVLLCSLSKRGKWMLTAAVWTALLAERILIGRFDTRLSGYFLIYAAGILMDSKTYRMLVNGKSFCLCLALFLAMTFSPVNIPILGFLVGSYAFVFMLLSLSAFLGKSRLIAGLSYEIALSSMCAFLFHRQVFELLKRWVGVFSLPFAYLVALPLLLILSLGMQKTYSIWVKEPLLEALRVK